MEQNSMNQGQSSNSKEMNRWQTTKKRLNLGETQKEIIGKMSTGGQHPLILIETSEEIFKMILPEEMTHTQEQKIKEIFRERNQEKEGTIITLKITDQDVVEVKGDQ